MEGKELDKLFREKLGRHELEPSAQAWNQVRDQLKVESSGFGRMRVAAAVAILATLSWMVIDAQTDEPTDMAFFTPNAPAAPMAFSFALPEIKASVVPVAQDSQSQVEKYVEKTVLIEEPVLLETRREMPGQVASVKINSLMEPEESIFDSNATFQMTYIASETSDESRRGIQRLLARAKDMTPGEMWASIRESKNDLFSKN